MFGIDEFYDGLLLEAKSPEEIKRIYGYQFVEGKGVPQEILDQVFELDPTKKKTFTKWLLLKWPDESNLIRSSLSNGKIGEMFRYFQERARDGLNLADVKSVSDALRMLPNNDPIFASIPDDEKDNPENQFKIVYDSPEWRVVRPFTYEADAKLGAGSMWCTAGAYGDGERYWEDYSDDGPIWVNFDMRVSEIAPRDKKEYPYKRYQFCFEANDFKGELTDINDSRIDFEKIDMPQEVIEFYGKINRKYQDCIESNGDNTKIIEKYNEERFERGRVLKEWDGSQLLALPLFNEYFEADANDGYGIYQTLDITDTATLDEYDSIDEIKVIDTCEGYPAIVLRDHYGDPFLMYYYDGIWENHLLIDYGKNNDAYYFLIDSNVHYTPTVIVFFKGMNSFVGRTVLEDAEKVTALDFNVPELGEGIWLQIRNEDGSNSLLFVGKNQSNEMFIMADSPDKGDTFRIVKIGNMYVVPGQNKTHIIIGEKETSNINMENFTMLRHLIAYPDILLVAYEKDDRRYMALIDDKKHDYILKDVGFIKDLGRIVNVKTKKGQEFLFNPKSGAKSKIYIGFGELDNIRLMVAYDDGKKYIVKTDGDIFEEFGPFSKVFQMVNSDIVLISKVDDAVGDVHSFSLSTKKFGLPDGIKNIGDFTNGNTPLAMVQDKERNIFIINCQTNEILVNNMGLERPLWITAFNNELFWLYKQKDGKYNIFSDKRGTILPGGMDNLENRQIQKHILTGINNGKRLFIDIQPESYRILPSDYGIDLNMISQFSLSNMSGRATIVTSDGSISFEYDPEFNRVMQIKPNTPEAQQTVNKIMFPERVQVSEEFNNFYNRIRRV